jgi:hypothetical protein
MSQAPAESELAHLDKATLRNHTHLGKTIRVAQPRGSQEARFWLIWGEEPSAVVGRFPLPFSVSHQRCGAIFGVWFSG